jgi:D-beta-D-heptose 7-phosphate kinase/D-beta-D-heptose 1-phosphate adenosyltransferase
MDEKVIHRDELEERVRLLKGQGKKIVFTNGCFDFLHVGHIRYLKAAKALGDVLIVAVNSDCSVRQIKGPSRPIVPEKERAEVLAALACVDMVTIFDEPDPMVTIRSVMPHVLVKGADWAEDAIVGKEVVEQAGGKVVRIPVTEGVSTSRILARILGDRG